MGDIWGLLIYLKTHISHRTSFNIPFLVGLATLAPMLNENEICLHTTNCPSWKISDLPNAPPFVDCFGQLVSLIVIWDCFGQLVSLIVIWDCFGQLVSLIVIWDSFGQLVSLIVIWDCFGQLVSLLCYMRLFWSAGIPTVLCETILVSWYPYCVIWNCFGQLVSLLVIWDCCGQLVSLLLYETVVVSWYPYCYVRLFWSAGIPTVMWDCFGQLVSLLLCKTVFGQLVSLLLCETVLVSWYPYCYVRLFWSAGIPTVIWY